MGHLCRRGDIGRIGGAAHLRVTMGMEVDAAHVRVKVTGRAVVTVKVKSVDEDAVTLSEAAGEGRKLGPAFTKPAPKRRVY